MSAQLIGLVAKGKQDEILINNDINYSFFKHVYRRQTSMAIGIHKQLFNNTVAFGSTIRTAIERKGDLLSDMIVHIKLPEIINEYTSGVTKTKLFEWKEFVGLQLLKNIELKIGNQLIDKQTGEWLRIWNELTEEGTKEECFKNMVGNNTSNERELFVPLNFFFCKHIGSALPLIALQYHEIELIININEIDKCIKLTEQAIHDYKEDKVETAILSNQIDLQLINEVIYLDNEERQHFAQKEHNILIEQIQYIPEIFSNSQLSKVTLNLNHPVKEIIMLVDGFEEDETEILTSNSFVESLQLLMNGNEFWPELPGNYFRLSVPYKRHSKIPNMSNLFVISFAIKPEDLEPSGTINFSRIDSSILKIKKNKTVNDGTIVNDVLIRGYAVNYNCLKIMSGLAGLQFAN